MDVRGTSPLEMNLDEAPQLSPRKQAAMQRRVSLPTFQQMPNCNKQKRLSTSYTADMQLSRMNIADLKMSQLVPIKPDEHKVLKTYFIQRTANFSIRGRTYTYTITDDKFQVLYSAKTKKRYPTDLIKICEGEDAHIDCDYQYELVQSMENTHFILEPKNSQKEIMAFDTKPECSLTKTPRKTGVIIYEEADKILEMTSREPTREKGDWKLDFSDRLAIPSQKNTIFQQVTNQKESFEFLAFRKIAKNSIACDCGKEFDPIVVFGIALSLYNARLKA